MSQWVCMSDCVCVSVLIVCVFHFQCVHVSVRVCACMSDCACVSVLTVCVSQCVHVCTSQCACVSVKHQVTYLLSYIVQCASCWKEALYYCCWNTSYCSYACQQRHWTIHQNDCRQAIDAVSTAADVATTVEATILTTAVTTKTAEPDLKSLLGKGGTNSAEKDERIQVMV